MCGIIGYAGKQEALPVLLEGLSRLEYRGYDSAGVAVADDGRLAVCKAAGRVAALAARLNGEAVPGRMGIGHTRWATHGPPSDANAHPHMDCAGEIALVHNGIIANHASLRARLQADGHRFRSETDTEVIAHLLETASCSDPAAALARALEELEGDFALAILWRRTPGSLWVARRGTPPAAVAVGEGEAFVASDVAGLLGRAQQAVHLEDGELAEVRPGALRLWGRDGRPAVARPVPIPWSSAAAERGPYADFMRKEIQEQPQAIRDTVLPQVDLERGFVLPESIPLLDLGRQVQRVLLLACGTSWHAAVIGRQYLERLARLMVEVEIASEFRHRDPVLDGGTLVVPISQSGETADTLSALRNARARGARTMAICNVRGSSIAREAEATVYTEAGPEIGVAATKTFVTQVAALFLLALRLGLARGHLHAVDVRGLAKELLDIPSLLEEVLSQEPAIREVATRYAERTNALFLGRGLQHPVALEGALKLKEIAYVHAEGYAAGEMKHGPIALIDEQMPVVVLAPRDATFERIMGNIEEVKARGGSVIAVGHRGDEELAGRAQHCIGVPAAADLLMPFLTVVPLQLLAYHSALLRGCDVDKPRNLAKSVTVE